MQNELDSCVCLFPCSKVKSTSWTSGGIINFGSVRNFDFRRRVSVSYPQQHHSKLKFRAQIENMWMSQFDCVSRQAYRESDAARPFLEFKALYESYRVKKILLLHVGDVWLFQSVDFKFVVPRVQVSKFFFSDPQRLVAFSTCVTMVRYACVAVVRWCWQGGGMLPCVVHCLSCFLLFPYSTALDQHPLFERIKNSFPRMEQKMEHSFLRMFHLFAPDLQVK